VAVLLAAGVGLVLFGALVLLRFPDRPGGRIAWHEFEVSSVGAGLPLVVVGIAAIAVAATFDGGDEAPGGEEAAIATAGIAASESHPCPEFFAGIPSRRIASLEEGVTDRVVVRPSEPKAGPIGLSFTDAGRPVGALRIVYFPVNGLFKVDGLVDARCRPVTSFENLDRPDSDPGTLQNYDTLVIAFGDRRYALRTGGGTDVRFNFLRAAA
jgi:hypothetical protein